MMSSTSAIPSPSSDKSATSIEVESLREQFLALRADYHTLRVAFANLDHISCFAEPDWFELDDLAVKLHDNLRAREQELIPVEDAQRARYYYLRSAFRQIRDKLVVFRHRLEGRYAYNYPAHVNFQVLGPGNQVSVAATSVSSDFTAVRQKYARKISLKRRAAEMAVETNCMSGSLSSPRQNYGKMPELGAADQKEAKRRRIFADK